MLAYLIGSGLSICSLKRPGAQQPSLVLRSGGCLESLLSSVHIGRPKEAGSDVNKGCQQQLQSGEYVFQQEVQWAGKLPCLSLRCVTLGPTAEGVAHFRAEPFLLSYPSR